ncbi:MAG: glycoside hydrolase [Actinobacteria bacterium]|nr:MAG: glycoside hydrolase [Actinomycetota bacterium]
MQQVDSRETRGSAHIYRHPLRVLLLTILVVMLGVLGMMPSGVALSTTPVYSGDFPDPSVLAANGRYYSYATGSNGLNLQTMNSPELMTWGAVSDPVPNLPNWAQRGLTWAPAVMQFGSTYVMYYTARSRSLHMQCISVASSSTPAGPFIDSSRSPLICQKKLGGSIDPQPFRSPVGTPYLTWKSDDNAVGQPTSLWSQQLSPDGRTLIGSPTNLLTAAATWQGGVIEGPSMWSTNGTYYLFYGANDWSSANAAIGYATCSGPLGPCVNQSVTAAWMTSHGAGLGPSGPTIFTDTGGATRIAYHAWTGGVGYGNGVPCDRLATCRGQAPMRLL